MSVLDAPARALPGPPSGERCAACDAPLAHDQRFCLACGLRCAPDELRLATLPLAAAALPSAGAVLALPSHRRPLVRSAAATAIVVLTLRVAIGATIGPATVGRSAAAQQAPLLVVSAPAAAPAPGDAGDTTDTGPDASAEAPPADEVVDLPSGSSSTEPAAPSEPAPTPADERPPDDGMTDEPADMPPPGSTQLAGTVLAADADRFTLSARDGALLEVHASGCGVQPGDDLHLRARRLANGTWAADRVRVLPQPARRLAVAGTVVWVDPAGGRYALGARGATLLVTLPQPVAGTPAPPPLPVVGERAQVAFEPPAAGQAGDPPAPLVERSRMVLPADPQAQAPPLPLELRGRVVAVDPQERTLALALDPADPATTIALTIPPAIEPSRVPPAQDVAVTATRTADAYALTGVSADADASAADDASTIQGDQRPSDASRGADGTVTTCTLLSRS